MASLLTGTDEYQFLQLIIIKLITYRPLVSRKNVAMWGTEPLALWAALGVSGCLWVSLGVSGCLWASLKDTLETSRDTQRHLSSPECQIFFGRIEITWSNLGFSRTKPLFSDVEVRERSLVVNKLSSSYRTGLVTTCLYT